MDLVNVFRNIGLAEGKSEGEDASYDSGRSGTIGDVNAPTLDHLQRYYIVSRGKALPPLQGD